MPGQQLCLRQHETLPGQKLDLRQHKTFPAAMMSRQNSTRNPPSILMPGTTDIGEMEA